MYILLLVSPPQYKKYINKQERVQHTSTRMFRGMEYISYKQELGLFILKKIVSGNIIYSLCAP